MIINVEREPGDDPIHAGMRKLADDLGGTYIPDDDGDGGTLYVANYLSKLVAMPQADGDPGDCSDWAGCP